MLNLATGKAFTRRDSIKGLAAILAAGCAPAIASAASRGAGGRVRMVGARTAAWIGDKLPYEREVLALRFGNYGIYGQKTYLKIDLGSQYNLDDIKLKVRYRISSEWPPTPIGGGVDSDGNVFVFGEAAIGHRGFYSQRGGVERDTFVWQETYSLLGDLEDTKDYLKVTRSDGVAATVSTAVSSSATIRHIGFGHVLSNSGAENTNVSTGYGGYFYLAVDGNAICDCIPVVYYNEGNLLRGGLYDRVSKTIIRYSGNADITQWIEKT